MLSFLKTPNDKHSAVTVPAWHPNFRNPERLPDTKVVRTSFFINGVAIIVTMVLAAYVAYNEYELATLRSDTASALSSIEASKPASDQAVALYRKFQEEEKKVVALQAFLSTSRIVISDFILQLGGSLPPSITLNSIDCRPDSVSLRGSIEGSPDEASGRAVAYVESLRKNEVMGRLFETVSLTNIVRDPGTGRIQFVIDLKLKPHSKKP